MHEPKISFAVGDDLVEYVSGLGWTVEGSVVTIPPNPDNQVEPTVVRENIQLQRECSTPDPCNSYPIYDFFFLNRVIKNYRTYCEGFMIQSCADPTFHLRIICPDSIRSVDYQADIYICLSTLRNFLRTERYPMLRRQQLYPKSPLRTPSEEGQRQANYTSLPTQLLQIQDL